jgi:hypothetical protein
MVSPAKVADRATANSNSAVTTVDLVLSGLTVGHFLLIRVAADNSGGSGAARTVTVTNQSGTPIDTATDQQFNQLNDPGAASAGTNLTVVVAQITATSGTVRLTFSGSAVAAVVAEQWSGIDPTTPVVGTPVGANGTASTNLASTTDASVASGNVAYAATAVEGPAGDTFTKDADTTNGSWVALTKVGTTNGTADTNQSIGGAYKIATGTGGQTHNPTNSVARDSAGLILELGQLATVSLTVADSGHGHAADTVALTEHGSLTVADSAHASTADPVTLTAHDPSVGLVVSDSVHGHTAEPVALTQHNVIAPADSGHGHTAETLALTQHHALTVSDAAHGHGTDSLALTQHHALAVADSTHGHGTDALALTQHHVLGPTDSLHGHTADSPTLTAHDPGAGLAVADTSHGHTVAPLTLVQHHVLVVAECILQHAAEQVALEQHNVLAAAESILAHTADQIAFGSAAAPRRTQGREPGLSASGARPDPQTAGRRPPSSFQGSST